MSIVENHSDGPWTIRKLLTWTRDFLQRKGSESPRLDAEVMLAEVLGWQRVELYTHFDDEVGDRARAAFRELVRRRAEGAPVAYLVGRKEFYSLPLAVNSAVLIPRPESEFVVMEFLQECRSVANPRVADVGTGSGCLAIACAAKRADATFTAIDISPEALALARSNAERHGVIERIDFRLGDALEPVRSEPPFDAVISNPPYIPSDDIASLEPGVRDYEPRLALDGGPDGLRVVARIIDQAVELLKPGGHLILEIGSEQEPSVRALIESHASYWLAPTVFDLRKHPRVIRAVRLSDDR